MEVGTSDLIMWLALATISSCPVSSHSIRELKDKIIDELSRRGIMLDSEAGDRKDIPVH